jgi:hypothetical protein
MFLVGTSQGLLPQPASAAGKPFDELSGQIGILQGQINALQAQVNAMAQGASLLVVHARSGNHIVLQGTNTLVPLDVVEGNPITRSNTFNAAGDLTVTYTAECTVETPISSDAAWLSIDIELVNVVTNDVVVLSPSTGTNDVFCTGNVDLTGKNLGAMNSITGIAKNLPSANYAVQIRATIQIINDETGKRGSLGDSSLVVRK